MGEQNGQRKRKQMKSKAYLVIKHNGDGYHLLEPEYVAVYFDADEAACRASAENEKGLGYHSVETVPIACKEGVEE